MPVIPLLGALFGNELSSNLTISGKRRYSNQLMNIIKVNIIVLHLSSSSSLPIIAKLDDIAYIGDDPGPNQCVFDYFSLSIFVWRSMINITELR